VVTYLLDSSAVLRFTDNEAGAARVEAILGEHVSGLCHVAISALHWGEVAGQLYRMRPAGVMQNVLQRLREMGITVIAATGEQAVHAAQIRADHKIPYVDAFGVALVSAPDHVFVTADFDLKPAEKLVRIEFLPAK
jgi:predicted nucleic acid-binding protein